MTSRTAWRWSLLAGLIAFACSWGFGRIAGLHACGPSGGLGAIIAFEFARTPADVASLFGSEPCRSTLIAAQRTGLLLDGLGFIPAYTLFLVLATFASAPAQAGIQPDSVFRESAFGAKRRGWAPAFAGALVIAGLCDEIEGLILHAILQQLPGSRGQLAVLFWPVHVKFALLGIGTVAIGAFLIAGKRPLAILTGAIIASGGGYALYGLAADLPRMMTGFALAWFAILATAVTASFWPSSFSARAAPLPSPASPSA